MSNLDGSFKQVVPSGINAVMNIRSLFTIREQEKVDVNILLCYSFRNNSGVKVFTVKTLSITEGLKENK